MDVPQTGETNASRLMSMSKAFIEQAVVICLSRSEEYFFVKICVALNLKFTQEFIYSSNKLLFRYFLHVSG